MNHAPSNERRVRAAIVGVTGYTGQELVRLLSSHPHFEIVALFGSTKADRSRSVSAETPSLSGLVDLPIEPGSADAVLTHSPEIVFLATPHEASCHLAASRSLSDPDVTIIDLSGGFRLPAEAYPEHYGFEHPAEALLGKAVYGLPELARAGLAGAKLVACAGCYVTAATLPLVPLIDAGLLKPRTTPIIDAISGVSGAGRSVSSKTSFGEVSLRPYGVDGHRHTPEIERNCGTGVIFQPHLAPFFRGILATIYAEVADGVSAADVGRAFEEAYGDEPFVRLRGDIAEGAPAPTVADVERTNFVDLGWFVADGRVRLFSAIDNLVKGASGQAVQCANAVFGFDECAGLLPRRTGALEGAGS